MEEGKPAPYQERTWGAMMFMLFPLALAGCLLAQLLAGAVGWLFAVPLAFVLTVGLFALFHMGQGGGAKTVELGCSAWILAVVLLLVQPVLRSIGEQRNALICRDNLRRIGVAMKLYTSANDGLYPLGGNWMATIRPLLPPPGNRFAKDPFVCPTMGRRASYFYEAPQGKPKPDAVMIEEFPFGKLHRTGGKNGTFVLLVSGEIRRRDPVKGIVMPKDTRR